MTRRFHERYDGPHLEKCRALGLNLDPFPYGDSHHTDFDATAEDNAIGNALAYFLGSLFPDESPRYFYEERTSVDEWVRIARALRLHGLRMVGRKEIDRLITENSDLRRTVGEFIKQFDPEIIAEHGYQGEWNDMCDAYFTASGKQ